MSSGISQVSGTSCVCNPGQERALGVPGPEMSLTPSGVWQALAQLSYVTDPSTEPGNSSPLGSGQGMWHASVPRSVVGPGAHLTPLAPGAAQELVSVSGHLPWVWSGPSTTVPCGRQKKDTGQRRKQLCPWSLTVRDTPANPPGVFPASMEAPSSDPWPGLGSTGKVAGHMPAMCRACACCLRCMLSARTGFPDP